MVMMAAKISSGCPARADWNAPAVPLKLPRMPTGTPSSATALFTASAACDSDTPGARLKLMVLAGVPRSWLTDSGVLVVVMRANAVSGTCWPTLFTKKKPRSVSGLCRYCGAASITTRYWLRGL